MLVPKDKIGRDAAEPWVRRSESNRLNQCSPVSIPSGFPRRGRRGKAYSFTALIWPTQWSGPMRPLAKSAIWSKT
jgi:hypothetical protein